MSFRQARTAILLLWLSPDSAHVIVAPDIRAALSVHNSIRDQSTRNPAHACGQQIQQDSAAHVQFVMVFTGQAGAYAWPRHADRVSMLLTWNICQMSQSHPDLA